MISLPAAVRVYLYTAPCDMRRGFDGLRTLVRQHDAPVATITYYAQWLLQKSIAEHGYRISVTWRPKLTKVFLSVVSEGIQKFSLGSRKGSVPNSL